MRIFRAISGSDAPRAAQGNCLGRLTCVNNLAMAYSFSEQSRDRLRNVHPDLRRVFDAAIATSPVDFMITEGLRTIERQRKLYAAGATMTLNSRHLTGHAVDIAPWVDGTLRWDWQLFRLIAPHIKDVAERLGVPLVWGGDWRSFKDGPHFELNRRKYA